ncbi:GntR family transcriptional regulator [Tamaricihabitans halophyticus]|uniref:GntR family transcriptional regulator n=1 Tax=Tamaricihabitans halophyticus TaxID=1262583 RepID=UPI001FB41C99|nr:GntR family transcriptional regulator [Tamaricihabitans halophyticus]
MTIGATAVADRLEEEIVLGLRFPRERLIEDELMARFDAKRHAVRSALRELENRGLTERKPNAGAFVKSYSAKEVRDLYNVRELLETSCAQLIEFPVPGERIDELAEIQHGHDTAVAAKDLRAVVSANMAFHQALFGLADNIVLVRAIGRHARMAHVMRSVTVTDPEYLERSRSEHWTMLRALRTGDAELLADTCRAHLLPSRDAYLRRIADLAAADPDGRQSG